MKGSARGLRETCVTASHQAGLLLLLGHQGGLAPGLIPQGQFDAVPQPELVIDDPQVVLHDMFSRSDRFGDLTVLQSLCNELDDSLLTFTGDAGSVPFTCRHACLRYNRVASFTRLIPPSIPKRRN